MPVETSSKGADFAHYQQSRIRQWDEVARWSDHRAGWSGYYHRRLRDIYRFLVPPGQRVLEIGCGEGDLLAALKPARGMGVDFSPEMISRARARYPQLDFVLDDAHTLVMEEKFDVIILSDLINDLWDVQSVFDHIQPRTVTHTRLILNFYSRLWELPLGLAEAWNLAKPTLHQNWLTAEDVANLLGLADFEVIRRWEELLLPLPVPLLAPLFNRYLVKLPPFHFLALTNFLLARPRGHPEPMAQEPLVSVVIPVRNEAGNIPSIFDRVPELGSGTELLFVEGHSQDDTYEVIKREIARHPERRARLLRQSGTGKGDAIRLGFANASGEVLMILDADLTVPPEDLVRFFGALRTGKGEFINGVRLVYPRERHAMRFANFLGNKFFGLAISALLGQPIKDTLCGTKALWKKDYDQIAASRGYFGDFDPFGDFDLLFGATKLGLKIVDMPIRYQERTYGSTNIERWKHGWLLLRMMFLAALRIRFV
ncbi:MAG: glycosyltransferase [Anaerolineales bacterium]